MHKNRLYRIRHYHQVIQITPIIKLRLWIQRRYDNSKDKEEQPKHLKVMRKVVLPIYAIALPIDTRNYSIEPLLKLTKYTRHKVQPVILLAFMVPVIVVLWELMPFDTHQIREKYLQRRRNSSEVKGRCYCPVLLLKELLIEIVHNIEVEFKLKSLLNYKEELGYYAYGNEQRLDVDPVVRNVDVFDCLEDLSVDYVVGHLVSWVEATEGFDYKE